MTMAYLGLVRDGETCEDTWPVGLQPTSPDGPDELVAQLMC